MKNFFRLLILSLLVVGCIPNQATASPSRSPLPATPTIVPTSTSTPKPEAYTLRIEYSTTSDWSELYILDTSAILGMHLVEKQGVTSASKDYLSLSQTLAGAEALHQVGMIVDFYIPVDAITQPLHLKLQKGAINSSTIRFYEVKNDDEILLQEVIRYGYVPGDTDLNRYEFSFDLKALKENSTFSQTATPVPLSLVFEEDFESDLLGWESIIHNPYRDLRFSYSKDGLDFLSRTKGDFYDTNRPANLIALDGDFDIEVVFDRRVRLSGLWFSNGSVTQDSSDNWFYVLIEQGQPHSLNNWEKGRAHLGTYQPSHQYRGYINGGSHTLAGEIDDFITQQNGKIDMHLSFRGDKMIATVNGSPVVTDKNNLYLSKKYFMGFVIGGGDQFVVKALRVWIANKNDFEIVKAVQVGWQEAAPTFDAILSMTPITSTPTSMALTLSVPLTIDNFVGTWRNADPGSGGWARITITKDGETLFAHIFGECGQSHETLCDAGTSSTTFDGNPVVMFRDSDFVVEKIIFQREGNLLHAITFTHYTDTSGRPDRISEDYFHR